jgi:hypothetical protein
MTANVESILTRKVAKSFMEGFENVRTLSKAVNTSLLSKDYSEGDVGTKVYYPRPTDFTLIRTAAGDITGQNGNFTVGSSFAEVQPFFTVFADWNSLDDTIRLGGNLDDILNPAYCRMATGLETSMAEFMMINSGLSVGTPGTVVDSWKKVAQADALAVSMGWPTGKKYYAMNPYVAAELASAQSGLNQSAEMVEQAWKNAQVTTGIAGLTALKGSTLASYTTSVGADRAGTLSATPTATYVAHKDTMIQSVAVTGFQANLVVKKGEQVAVTTRARIALGTRLPFIDSTGAKVTWRGTVTADVTLGASGDGTLLIAGPAIFEAAGAQNTVESALTSGDVITLLGSASTTYQPNMFFHKNAFGVGSLKQKKLHSTDTLATTEDGLQIRVSKFSDPMANTQKIRFDLVAAFACFNPFLSGHAYG